MRAKTGPYDLLTAADRASETAIAETIRSSRPNDAILAEETGAHPGSTGIRWLVDPLDGTSNFVHDRPQHAVSVGVEISGRFRAGAILRPADGRWVMANEGGQVRCGVQDAASSRPGPIDEPHLPPPRSPAAREALVALASRPARRKVSPSSG